METAASSLQNPDDSIARMPAWLRLDHGQNLEEAAFMSGSALAHLHLLVLHGDVPNALWRARLALVAAEACAGFSRRRERAGELRDAVYLRRSGDHPGPAGEIFQNWTYAVARPISVARLGKALSRITPEQIALHIGAGLKGRQRTPVDLAAAVLEAVLADAPRAETEALILGDATLALALGWDHVLPLLAVGLKLRDLVKKGDALRLACHHALFTAAKLAVPLAADLASRAERLRAVAPKLRAKGADQAIALFLARDALVPSALTGFLSDRAARRLCDRLVELGALRELTGRNSFRIFGV
jgi:hypothetical protein